MLIGLLALQGDYSAHQKVLETLGASTQLVRTRAELEEVDGLILPGGESTTMARLLDRYDLRAPLVQRLNDGLPALGTCAGLILLAREIENTSTNFVQHSLGALDVRVARNAYGTQLDSFEAQIEVPVLAGTIRAVFIRAPQILEVGAAVEVLGSYEGVPVLVRQNQIMAASFHPEIAGESRIHQLWLDEIQPPKAEGAC